jgi:uncharacterized membrane protein (UPF0127 family)
MGIGLIVFGLWVLFGGLSSLLDDKRRLLAPNGYIEVEIVNTPETRQKGLSGRESLSVGSGMLFEFDQSSESNCFWMKDMNFSIDMIWMNEDREVITVKTNVAPETFPESFCPESPAKYGLEVVENRAESLEITPGVKLRW